jgi:hypothetical protein
MAPRVQSHPGARTTRRLTDVAKHSVAGGDPTAYAARIKAQEELLEAAENAVAWLESRRRHYPPQMRDGREGAHRKALQQAIAKLREA